MNDHERDIAKFIQATDEVEKLNNSNKKIKRKNCDVFDGKNYYP